jgi:hypothetical protein
MGLFMYGPLILFCATYLGFVVEALPGEGENLVLAGGKIIFVRHGVGSWC